MVEFGQTLRWDSIVSVKKLTHYSAQLIIGYTNLILMKVFFSQISSRISFKHDLLWWYNGLSKIPEDGRIIKVFLYWYLSPEPRYVCTVIWSGFPMVLPEPCHCAFDLYWLDSMAL